MLEMLIYCLACNRLVIKYIYVLFFKKKILTYL